MYSPNGLGEKYEVYNFGLSGATIDFIIENFPKLLAHYGRNGTIITVLSVGGNDAKAKDRPDNYVSTIEAYRKKVATLLDVLKSSSNHVVTVGGGYYNEAKTNPKISPFDGNKSFFTNQRKKKFEACLKELCREREIPFIETGVNEEIWKNKYLYQDGVHANTAGHELISKRVLAALEKLI